ncbi:hypothetical protein N7468_001004 [Penicillium chermesinum]|uniref:Pyrroline-5-carboxylate reductase n=1 Tax=Penicillium chermesinum TaxID=63820 RepID=A0A9W9TW64_9EURO|nr:uncharacterized protein N7468_001004 [Penicillium chermesinum]KAJ5246021.1 hypothetical protein N7468_001004 [Penicillium chermesinum]KAJ6144317.1 hypothetical protein N7470_008212 [Penicillium chermesinum]
MPSQERTIAFVGCGRGVPSQQMTQTAYNSTGNMGGAILHGVLRAAFPHPSDQSQARPISKFIACTKTAPSAERLKASISEAHQQYVHVVSAKMIESMQAADYIVLGFKPFMADDLLSLEGVKKAIAGKLVISLLAGQTPQNLARIIKQSSTEECPQPYIMKAIPNMGAQFRESMTTIEEPGEDFPPELRGVTDWIFTQIGDIKYLPQSQMDLASVLVGAALAAMTVPIEGILDGCVAEGLKRPDAMQLLLKGIRGLSAALESGIHPAVLRESISSPRGCTIQALLALEQAGSRADYAEAIIRGTQHLKKQ